MLGRGIFVVLVFICGAATMVVLSVSTATAQELRGRQEFTGTIVGVGGTLGGVTHPFTLTLDRFTPDAEARRDAQILRTRGQDALLDAIRKEKVGTFSLAGQVGRDVNFADARRIIGDPGGFGALRQSAGRRTDQLVAPTMRIVSKTGRIWAR